jgi:acetyl-CoA C-acetyltransferase
MSIDPRTPCVIGVAQATHRSAAADAPEPLSQWEQVATAAAADSGGDDVLGAVESLQVGYCQSWTYDDAPGRLAERLGVAPRHRLYSGLGGTTPQQLVQKAAESILDGAYDVALICGAEALATKRRLKKAGSRPAWSHPHPDRPPFPFEAPFHPAEIAHEVFQAWLTFATFDIARRAHLGIAPDEDRRLLGELLAPMTRVAATNPHAWFPIERTAHELITPTGQNRMVGYPYTKYEVAVMDVDMAAALVVCSHRRADELGVAPDRRVYLRGWCYASDPVYVAEHAELWRSPAMVAASTEALAGAGIGIDDVAYLDLYSCFGSSIRFAQDALGLRPDDGRGVTVTGGLPFAGGPGSGYLLHAVAAMVEQLRRDPGTFGLVSGVGMHMTKHVFGVYSTQPGASPPAPPDHDRLQARLDGDHPPVTIVDTHCGPATVAAYSVVHGRDGEAAWALAVCDVPGGGRCYARVVDPGLLADMERREWVGTAVRLVPGTSVGLSPEINVLQA